MMMADVKVEKEKDNGCWEGMAEELVVEILARLPVRSILRFKATCKTWKSLIESPFFVEFHARLARRRHHQKDRILFTQGPKSVYSFRPQSETWTKEFDFKLPELFNPYAYDFKILGPLHNGIYCLIPRISISGSRFALSNLATRAHHYTHPFPTDIDIPPEAKLSYGFGCIRNESGTVVDYKLVLNFITGDYFLSFLYSLQRGSWEKIAHVGRGSPYIASDPNYKAVSGLVNEHGEVQTPLSIHPPSEGCLQRFFHGSWHWLDWCDEYSDRVLLFDMLTEEFGFFAGPPHLISLLNVSCALSLLNDHLAAIYMPFTDPPSLGVDVWIMMDYGVAESWTKVYSCATPSYRPPRRYSYQFVGFDYPTDTTSSSCVKIDGIFLKEVYTGELVSIDGSGHIKEKYYNIFLQPYDFFLNTLGVSSYVGTLDSLTLPPIDSDQDPSS